MIFAITRARGSNWNHACSLEDQKDWSRHAEFMNGLHAEGIVLFGGPLEGTDDVLLIAQADSAQQITDRLSEDCWSIAELLVTKSIVPWQLRLGSLG